MEKLFTAFYNMMLCDVRKQADLIRIASLLSVCLSVIQTLSRPVVAGNTCVPWNSTCV